MRKILVIILILSIAIIVFLKKDRGEIKSVAPYVFNELSEVGFANSIEVKGGWLQSLNKYVSSVIYCDKELSVCSDSRAELYRGKGHLFLDAILWKIISWNDDAVVAESILIDRYPKSLLFIDVGVFDNHFQFFKYSIRSSWGKT